MKDPLIWVLSTSFVADRGREPVFVMNGEVNWSSFFVNLKLDKTAAQFGL
jgi:hypothetical protein